MLLLMSAPLEPIDATVVEQPPRPPQPHFGWALLWTLLLFFAQIGVGIVLGIALLLIGAAVDEAPEGPTVTAVMIGMGTFTTLLVAVAIVVGLFRSQAARVVALRNAHAVQWVLALLLLLPLATVAGEVINLAAEVLPTFNFEMFELLAMAPWPLIHLTACALPGIGEELFFRGFLSRGLIARHGVVLGSLAASLLFAMVHADPVHICGTLVLGLGIQYLFLMTQSLVVVIVFHSLNNAIAFALLKYSDLFYIQGVTELEEAAAGGTFHYLHTPLPLLGAAVLSSLLLLACLYQARTRWLRPDGSQWRMPWATTEIPADPTVRAVASWPRLWLVIMTLASYGLFTGTVWWVAE